MSFSRLHTYLFMAGCAFISACAPGSGEGLDSNGFPITADTVEIPLSASFAAIQANIFTPSCAISGCHTGPAPKEDLRLDKDFSYAEIVYQPSNKKADAFLIIPNDPDNSYLIQKLEGTIGILGKRMPLNRTPLPVEEIQVIRDWIIEGALNN